MTVRIPAWQQSIDDSMVVGAGNSQYVLLMLVVTLYVVSVQLWVDQLYLRLLRDASGVSIDANKAFMKSPAMNG